MIEQTKILIWGREFSLDIDYDCDREDEVMPTQEEALKDFLNHPSWLEESKSEVEKYCGGKVKEDATNNKKDNIFSYLKPDYIFVKQEKNKPRVALMCNYRYDEEHGVAVVFAKEGKITVGMQDIIL